MSVDEKAHAAAVLGLDASRRVGWARAFAAKQQVEDLSRDYNIAAGDRAAYKRGLSYLYGMFAQWTDDEQTAIARAILQEVAGYDALLDPNVVKAGRARAASIRAADDVWKEEKALAAAARRGRKAQHTQTWKEARARTIDSIAGRYGFKSLAEMRSVLEGWRVAAGRPRMTGTEFRKSIRTASFDPAADAERALWFEDVRRPPAAAHKGGAS